MARKLIKMSNKKKILSGKFILLDLDGVIFNSSNMRLSWNLCRKI